MTARMTHLSKRRRCTYPPVRARAGKAAVTVQQTLLDKRVERRVRSWAPPDSPPAQT